MYKGLKRIPCVYFQKFYERKRAWLRKRNPLNILAYLVLLPVNSSTVGSAEIVLPDMLILRLERTESVQSQFAYYSSHGVSQRPGHFSLL